jgi:hypothetical protein
MPNGNVFVGWGSSPFFSEYAKDGELLFDAEFLGSAQSYRAFRLRWTGHPTDDPAAAVERGSDDKLTHCVSWNGAKDVATWQVLAGPDPNQLEPAGSAPKRGLETAITVNTAEPYAAVQANSATGWVLGSTKAARPG